MDGHGAQASTGASMSLGNKPRAIAAATPPVPAHPPTIICVWWTWNPILTAPDLHDGSILRRRVPIRDLSFFCFVGGFLTTTAARPILVSLQR